MHLDDVVVAALVTLVPPAALDAFGADDHLLRCTLQRHRSLQQPERTSRASRLRGRFRIEWRESPRASGSMIGDAGETVQRRIAEACAQSFDEGGPVELFAPVRLEQVPVQRIERRQVVGVQCERVHRRGERDAFDACTREVEQRGCVALWREQADLDARAGGAFVLEPQFEALGATIAHGEEQREFANHPLQRERERDLRFDAVGEFDTSFVARGRMPSLQGFGSEPAQAIEMVECGLADAPGKFRARQAEQVTEQSQAHTVQCGDGFRGQAARDQRCGIEHWLKRGGGYRDAGIAGREDACSCGRRCGCERVVEA